jgi:hypothetical protein
MTARRAIVILVALVAAVVGWRLFKSSPPENAPEVRPPLAAAVQSPPPPAAEERSHLADQLNAPSSDIQADLHIVAEVIEAFRSNFPHTGNPVGTNAEITAALSGKNKLRLAVIPPDHPAINRAGELCDRWGTPLFFHAESGTRMEIRSAGPDRKMWNDDDVVLNP